MTRGVGEGGLGEGGGERNERRFEGKSDRDGNGKRQRNGACEKREGNAATDCVPVDERSEERRERNSESITDEIGVRTRIGRSKTFITARSRDSALSPSRFLLCVRVHKATRSTECNFDIEPWINIFFSIVLFLCASDKNYRL